jgi:minor histocompatibility antigen H13
MVTLCAGLFVALMLHFDARNSSGKRYFYSAMGGYAGGLLITIVVMNVFKAAQPALLYIVPCVCAAVFTQALLRNEVKKLWSFSDEEASKDVPAEGAKEVAGAEPAGAGATAEEGDEQVRTFDAGQSAPGFEVVEDVKKKN